MNDLRSYLHQLWYDANLHASVSGFVYLVAGALAGTYIRFLYRRFARVVSNRESFSSIFPALTLTMVLVILVVKASLALSLGLVGALSIVRFRAAIKEPEEIVYLFFCIAVGLALGAESPSITILSMFVFTGIVVAADKRRGGATPGALMLSISGEPEAELRVSPQALTGTVRDAVGGFSIQRLDIDGHELRFRAVIALDEDRDVGASLEQLHERLEGYRISYTSLERLL